MDFNLSPEQQLIKQTVSRIAQDVLAPKAAEIDANLSFPREGLAALSDAGLMGILLPQAFGGGSADTLSFVLATEETAKGCANTALIYVTHMAAALGLLMAGTDAAKQRLLPAMAKGEKLGAFAVTEPNCGANAFALQTTTQVQGDEYVLNGAKNFITSGGDADVYLILARMAGTAGPVGLTPFVVERGAPGFSLGKKDVRLGLNGVSSCELIFQDCRIPRDNIVGQEGGYFPALAMAVAGLGVLGAAAISIGLAQAAVDASVVYGAQRVVGGVPIGNWQAIQTHVSDMSAAVDAARALNYWAAFQRDNAPPGMPVLALKSKLFATEMAVDVCNRALQVHGGTGYTKEMPLERYYRDARGLTLHFSPSEMLRETIGRALMNLLPG